MLRAEKLIALVGNYPILYDSSHEDYKSTRKREKIWADIAKDVGSSAEEAKKRWRNLRDSYSKYIKSNKNKTKTGRETRKWVWANQMKPFLPYLKYTRRVSHSKDVDYQSNSSNDSSTGNNMESNENFEEDDAQEDVKPFEFFSDISVSAPSVASYSPTNNDSVAQKQTLDYSSSSKGGSQHLEYRDRMDFDATDYLFLAYAKTLKTFSRKRQVMTKMKIAEIMMKQELLHLEDSSVRVGGDPLGHEKTNQ